MPILSCQEYHLRCESKRNGMAPKTGIAKNTYMLAPRFFSAGIKGL